MARGVQVGDKAPDFTLPAQSGEPVMALQGQPVMDFASQPGPG